MSSRAETILAAAVAFAVFCAAWYQGDRLACVPESEGAVKVLLPLPEDAPEGAKPPSCYGIGISHEYRTYGLPEGENLKRYTLGFDKMIADLMFVDVVASTTWNEKRPAFVEWVYKMGDAITELHPKYRFVYFAIGTFLSFYKDQIHLSNAIFEKGAEVFPNEFAMPFYIAYNYYWELGEHEKARPYFEEACRRPNAPPHMCTLAAKMMLREQADPFQAANLMITGFCINADETRARIIRADFEDRVLMQVKDPEKREWLINYFNDRVRSCREAYDAAK